MRFVALLALLGVVVAGGLGAAWYMEHEGHYVTGMSNQIVWGTPHVFAVFLILAASGALNVASLASVFGRELYKPLARLSGLLAILRAMQISIHEGHWISRGASGYQDHLLLERVYSPLQEEIDGLGERIVGYVGPSYVDSRTVSRKSTSLIDAWAEAADTPIARALHAEESLQEAIQAVYDGLRAAGPVPLGLDDFLMSLASAHDTNRYLLRQALS